MIEFLRKLILEDFGLKLFSLVLAILIWLTVTFASRRELGTEKRILPNLPVRVVAAAEDVHNFRVSPGRVEVTVQGDPYFIRNLQNEDVRAMVDLTGVATAGELHKRIEVAVPPGVTCLRVTPDEAQIIFPPER